MRAWRRTAAGVLALAAVVAVCVGTTTAQAKKAPITILTIVDTTGATSYLGKADLAGINAAVTYFNNHGGIDGHQINNVIESDNGNPVTSATVLDKYLSSNPKPTYIFPGSFSTIAGALQPIISQDKILSWGFGDGNNACEFDANVKCNGFFSIAGSIAVDIQAVIKYLKQKHITSIGILQDLRDTSIVETEYWQQLAPKAGIKLYLQTFPASTVDLTPEMSALKGDNVPLIFSETIGPETGYLLNARAALNWTAPVIFDVSGASSTITKYVPQSEWGLNTSEEAFSDVLPSHSKHYPGLKLMLANNPTAVGPGGFGGSPINIAAFGWDAIDMLDNIISHTHSLNEQVNQKWMEHIPKKARITGRNALSSQYYYTPSNHEGVGWGPTDFSVVPLGVTNNQGFLVANS